jgi:hypothetical protein
LHPDVKRSKYVILKEDPKVVRNPGDVKKYVNLGFSKSIQKVVGNCGEVKKDKNM